ncbi:MAG: NAD(P)/FAD-dependent oxidoreductase [Verrucomicrobiae bacterium]|nr:NAD(P)/FAD-dependent oxidoreductase [Verrucomicrobiae bacterium]
MKKKTVVIIGSGLTGLCAGAILSMQGFQVVVLEANAECLGGHARSYCLDGQWICAGPQYVWGCGPGTIVARVLDYLGLRDEVRFCPMDPDGFEDIWVGNSRRLAIPMGLSKFCQVMQVQFPGHQKGIETFFGLVESLCRVSCVLEDRGLYLEAGPARMMRVLGSLSLPLIDKIRLLQFHACSLAELFDHCGLPPEARRVLYAHGGIFAENESSVSAVVYAAATGRYHAGAYFPVRGFKHLIDQLAAVIAGHGGSIHLGKRAAKLEVENRRIRRVVCDDRTRFEGDVVISNLSPRLTGLLLDGNLPEQYAYEPSNSLVGCFMTTKDYPEIHERLNGRNIWWQDGAGEIEFNHPDMWAGPRMIYAGSPGDHGGDLRGGSKRAQSLAVFAPGNYEQARQAWLEGPEIHLKLKRRIQDGIINILESRVFPGIGGKISHAMVETPWDIHQKLGAENGNVYGRRLSADGVLHRAYPRLSLDHLHCGCATVGMPGVTTCFKTASIITKKISGISI